jgi:hypothetical protein
VQALARGEENTALLGHCSYQNGHFTKTGSGQNIGKATLKNETVLLFTARSSTGGGDGEAAAVEVAAEVAVGSIVEAMMMGGGDGDESLDDDDDDSDDDDDDDLSLEPEPEPEPEQPSTSSSPSSSSSSSSSSSAAALRPAGATSPPSSSAASTPPAKTGSGQTTPNGPAARRRTLRTSASRTIGQKTHLFILRRHYSSENEMMNILPRHAREKEEEKLRKKRVFTTVLGKKAHLYLLCDAIY